MCIIECLVTRVYWQHHLKRYPVFCFVFSLDPEWVNLDGFAVLGGAPVSNSSAGKPDLKASLSTTHGSGVSQLTAIHVKLSG